MPSIWTPALLGLALALASPAPASSGFDSAAGMKGVYSVRLKADQREFQDCMVVSHVSQGSVGAFAGSYTVPGGFTSAIENGTLADREMTFSILADEPPRPYRVFFRLERTAGEPRVIEFQGVATLENGQLLGSVIIRRLTLPDGLCLRESP